MVQAYLPGSYRRDRPDPHPGLYESSIHTERSVVDHLIITDTPVVYGPWLEGVGSRNYPVTRFAGYHTFRRVSQLLDSMAEVKADSELTPYVERLNA
jgi:hypothetical protein